MQEFSVFHRIRVFIYPDVERDRPIRKEVNDWYGVGKPINIYDTVS